MQLNTAIVYMSWFISVIHSLTIIYWLFCF